MEFDEDFQVVLDPSYRDRNSYSWIYNYTPSMCSQSKNKFYSARFIDVVTNDYGINNYYYSTLWYLLLNKEYLEEKII